MTDKILAFILLILFVPFLLILLIIIFIEDGFPLIFKQVRVGLNDKKFIIYKIRTLKKNTPNISKEKINENKYSLKYGKKLRSFHLDELPQLFNVLKGDLKFIGYRPALPSHKNILKYRNELGLNTFKPGITGWAQLFYYKNQTYKEKVNLEAVYYYSNMNLDLKIIYYTFIKILKSPKWI